MRLTKGKAEGLLKTVLALWASRRVLGTPPESLQQSETLWSLSVSVYLFTFSLMVPSEAPKSPVVMWDCALLQLFL